MRAYAKINLVLDITGKFDNGYHSLKGIMHSVSLYDEVGVMPLFHTKNITVESNIPLPTDNTAYKAAKLYYEAAKLSCGAKIFIIKNIPSEAGLGGGSADAASVLMQLQERFSALNNDELYNVAKKVGADVPFCLMGGCAVAEGVGEILTSLPVQDMCVLLTKGQKGISTPELYREYDNMPRNKMYLPYADNAIEACKNMDTDKLCNNLYNALEEPAFMRMPELKKQKDTLYELGAEAALMTGSGACVYGIFKDEKVANSACEKIKGLGYDFTHVVRTI